MAIEKASYRKKFQALRTKLSDEARLAFSRRIADTIEGLNSYLEAETVFVYVSMTSEVVTTAFIENAIAMKKQVAVPRIDTDNQGKRCMQFYRIHGLADLVPGYYGIMEPMTDHVVTPKNGDLMIVPGLAFTQDGHRLGYGGGFYDRYMHKYGDINFHRVGVAFDIQITPFLPHESFDETVNMIITEKRILDT